ncbi:FACT complex subunit POB3 [Yarrowia lipolytica]|nr:FACT complex subunit POB3 [Yarrowia lipolytica]RDW47784.1 FACT complex subunit POB3 [Yarrowia lipolytica]RDW54004.1 FACT complex subunit POB3 [Yarrowia lipolytica]
MSTTEFDGIYLNQSKAQGRLRMVETGLGWKAVQKTSMGGSKETKKDEPFLLGKEELLAAFWSRGSRGFEMKIQTKNRGAANFDGFEQDNLEELKNVMKRNYGISVEQREHSVKGWNWGKTDFERSELVFSVANKPAFEIPYAEVANSNLVGKNEVALEFQQPADGRAGDELVEMRFYVPGVTSVEGDENPKKKQKTEKKEGEEGKEGDDDADADDESEEEVQSTAQIFYDTLKEKADIGAVAGTAVVSLSEIYLVIPRGRYDIDMYANFMRLRGKTYDYMVQYKHVQRLIVLPKPDDLHNILVVQLDPPLRQGQTRYPFLVMQFLREAEIKVELNVDDAEFAEKYADKGLKQSYDESAHQVVGSIFRGLTGRKLTVPGSFKTVHGHAGVSCSLKASEGHLYPLERNFLFLSKPVFIPFAEIQDITLSRVGSSVTTSRTFDMTLKLRNAQGEYQFSNISKEEQEGLEAFIKSKGIRLKNDLAEEKALLAATLAEVDDDSDDGGEFRGSADEDDESPDEDFHAESDSEVAEEFDSNAESSSGEEDDE